MPSPCRAIAVLALLLAGLVLAGCSAVVVGRASPADGRADNARPDELRVAGATENAVDEMARNALADLETYWAEQFPAVYGEDFTPLRGGYFSVDPNAVDPAQYPRGVGCGSEPSEAEDNAFYCRAPNTPNSDAITYDRVFLGELSRDYGRFIPAMVMAHEFGHAVQGRVGMPEASILAETQADCFAGA
jgi:predicted metalloprotease